MTKVVHCTDLGFDCAAVVRADSEGGALDMVAQHPKEVHGMQEVSPEFVEKAHEVMRTECPALTT